MRRVFGLPILMGLQLGGHIPKCFIDFTRQIVFVTLLALEVSRMSNNSVTLDVSNPFLAPPCPHASSRRD